MSPSIDFNTTDVLDLNTTSTLFRPKSRAASALLVRSVMRYLSRGHPERWVLALNNLAVSLWLRQISFQPFSAPIHPNHTWDYTWPQIN
jgi:hypothetical protein